MRRFAMKKLFGKKWTLAAALAPVLGLGMAGYLAAQGARPAQNAPNQPNQRQPAQAGRHENLDHYFATCLILDNDNEIQAARLAKDKADDAEVKKFASMMQSDHEKFIKELERFG